MVGLFNHTITLLNRVKGNDFNDTYYKTVINNVCLQYKIKANDNATNSSADSHCYVYIHKDMLPKPYLKPISWINSSNKSNVLTFKQDDYFVVGEISETTINDINSIYNTYDNVFKIYSVADFNVIDSFHIKGK